MASHVGPSLISAYSQPNQKIQYSDTYSSWRSQSESANPANDAFSADTASPVAASRSVEIHDGSCHSAHREHERNLPRGVTMRSTAPSSQYESDTHYSAGTTPSIKLDRQRRRRSHLEQDAIKSLVLMSTSLCTPNGSPRSADSRVN